MSKRYGRLVAAAGGLAAFFLLGAAPVSPPSKPETPAKTAQPQPDAEGDSAEGLTTYEREALAVDRTANRIAEAANRIALEQRDFALWQLFLAAFGVAFTGVAAFFAYRATHWAKEAAAQSKRSADADNIALSEAREDAVKQTERFDRQMKAAEESVAVARASAMAADRAWIDIASELVLGISVQSGQASATVQSRFTNVGRSPAASVLLSAAEMFTTHEAIERAVASRIEQIAQLRGEEGVGLVLFPTDSLTATHGTECAIEDEDGLRRSVERALATPLHDPPELPMILVGAAYSLPGDDEARYTFRVFSVRLADYEGDEDFEAEFRDERQFHWRQQADGSMFLDSNYFELKPVFFSNLIK